MPRIDWRAVRAEFPALDGRVYLNTATYGQLPRRTSEAVVQHLTRRDAKACVDFLSWFDDLDQIRAAIGRLIHAAPEDIAFIPSASHGLALVMSGFDWQPGDEIVTLENEFPNQLYAAYSRRGVRGIECAWHNLEQHITSRTRLALLSTVNYATGFRPNLAPVIDSLRRRGILVYLDGTQSIGALEFDISLLKPDFVAVDAYKWMLAPNGAGFLYVNPDVRKWLRPNVIGWRSHFAWRNVDDLHHGAPLFAEAAEKYEGGMVPFPSLYGLQASLNLFEELGASNIEARVLELTVCLCEQLQTLSAEFYPLSNGCLPSQIVLARMPATDSSQIAQALEKQDIYVSAGKGYLRISSHFYNDETDIAALIKALRA
jgi:cysteine desulfurase / selenocysteine lyase